MEIKQFCYGLPACPDAGTPRGHKFDTFTCRPVSCAERAGNRGVVRVATAYKACYTNDPNCKGDSTFINGVL